MNKEKITELLSDIDCEIDNNRDLITFDYCGKKFEIRVMEAQRA